LAPSQNNTKCSGNRDKGNTSAIVKNAQIAGWDPQTFAQETAITIFAPDFAMPFASDLEPTYQINMHYIFILHQITSRVVFQYHNSKLLRERILKFKNS